ncbi:MAG TPA: hypothetical protein VNK95_04845 [Caldilineaceae bacterium]|nr:hypothetical protein [Caldilineaceae bacterium]
MIRRPALLGLVETFHWPRRPVGRRVWFAALGVVVGCLLLATVAGPLRAAIELAYYRATSTESAVLLEWATVREFNVAGFEILCKRASEPDTSYHPIGSRIATGGPDQGAVYTFNVTSGLAYGEAYCFRLREITTDATPGEQFDLCGYGPGVAPAADQLSAGATLTPTVIIIQAPPELGPVPTLVTPGVILPGMTDTPTPTPFSQFQSPLPGVPFTPTPTATPTVLAQQQQFFSPLETPVGEAPNAGVAGVDQGTPPTVEPGMLPANPLIPPADAPEPPISPTATITPVGGLALPGAPLAETGGTGALATPTPLYVVVTATPTPAEAAAAALPTFTPWPTATPPPAFQLTSLLAPSTQNLMVMLLCLIFLSATGLGALGLVTSVIYMRSQIHRDRLPGPVNGRRRF